MCMSLSMLCEMGVDWVFSCSSELGPFPGRQSVYIWQHIYTTVYSVSWLKQISERSWVICVSISQQSKRGVENSSLDLLLSLTESRCLLWLKLIVCCCFTSLQHVRSYQDGYQLLPGSVLTVTLQHCPTGGTGHQHHDLISHSVTLSWHWVMQSLP